MSIMDKILKLLHEQKKSQADICKYLGIKPNVFTTWKTRGTDPPAKFLVRICEFFDVSLEYLLVEDNLEASDKTSEKYRIDMGIGNTYAAPVHNTTGEKIVINNNMYSSSESTSTSTDKESKYPVIIMYLESLDEKKKRHAIVDVEYMLENEYGIDEQVITGHSRDTGYQRIISYLDSLDEKNRRHAVVDVEYMLENDYEVKKNSR